MLRGMPPAPRPVPLYDLVFLLRLLRRGGRNSVLASSLRLGESMFTCDVGFERPDSHVSPNMSFANLQSYHCARF